MTRRRSRVLEVSLGAVCAAECRHLTEVYVCMYVCMCVRVYVCTCVCVMYIDVYIYVYFYVNVYIGSSDDGEEKYDVETQEMAKLMGVTPEELSKTMSKTAKAQILKSPIYIHLNTKYTRALTLKDPSPISKGCCTRRTGCSNTQEAGQATQGSGADSGGGPCSGQCLWCRARWGFGTGNRSGQESRPQEEKC